ncbi:MAG: LPS export ABC transporter periplasmic protein LptC [Acidaminococcaceae bacterium]|nr:LPS export ABC transporter periplasmic protein LptC [Acidaminococcaceae bacterium]MDD4723022.1 LPS export ABC transporter periplasmic protein LptC [Acidaminococcaceae bacterium]
MKNKKTILYIIGALVIMTAIFAWLMAGTGGVKPPVPSGRIVAPHELKNTSLHEENQGKKIWDLQIASLVYDADRDVNVLTGVTGKFYQEDGSNIAIKSDAGEVNMKTKTITLTGNAKGVFSGGGDIVGDKLTWSSITKLITAEGNAKLTKDDIVATANKAIMDTANEHFKLEGDALVQKGVE